MNDHTATISVPEKCSEWIELSPDITSDVDRSAWGLSPLIARLAARRGFDTLESLNDYLNPVLSKVHDPSLMKDMDKAIDRIVRALKKKERILIFGDYDADGLTASALLQRAFAWLNHEVEVHIPNRLSDGYGLKIDAMKRIQATGVDLLITVDNGVNSVDEIAWAQKNGLDVIVTDHHQFHPPLPDAVAVVNPHRPDCNYPYKDLCGVGVAFKLAHALLRKLFPGGRDARKFISGLLDLVALGTIADVMPLDGENRILVKHGLPLLQRTEKVGLKHMIEAQGLNRNTLSSRSVAFVIVPRLNAAGRVFDPNVALEVLTTNDPLKAMELSNKLDNYNKERRATEDEILSRALISIDEQGLDNYPVLVAAGENWCLGVLGLVAGRLARQFYKPAICLDIDQNVARGSCRSVEEFDIHEALCACEDFLENFGGHHQAAGLTIKQSNIENFRRAVGEHFKQTLGVDKLIPSLKLDSWLDLDDITWDAVSDLKLMEPWGAGNPQPVFALADVDIAGKPRALRKNTLKFAIKTPQGRVSIIGFGMAEEVISMLEENTGQIDIAFSPGLDSWNGNESVTLYLEAIRVRKT